jgi:hypothetical protein
MGGGLRKPKLERRDESTATESESHVGSDVTRASSIAGRVLGVIAVLVFLVCATQAFMGGTRVGISSDERNHQTRMNTWFETRWYVPVSFLEDGQPRRDIEAGRYHAYGAGYSIFGHAIAVLAGAEEPGRTNRTAEAYAARHIAVAILGVASALAVGYSLLVITGSALIGVWTAAAAMAMPLWTGYSMFAVKDVPAAAGYSFVTAAMVIAMRFKPGWVRPVSIGALGMVGVWFSVGVRAALWLPVAFALLLYGMLLLASRHRAILTRNAIALVCGMGSGLVAVALMHPHSGRRPIEWLLASVRTSADFHWTGATLSAGQLVTEKPPWWYLPAWISGSVPVLIGLLTILGLVCAGRVLWRRTEGGHGWLWGRAGDTDAAVILWVVQASLLPLGSIVVGATMYAGLRQHLYVLPALAALAGFGAHRVARHWRSAPVVAGFLAAALMLPTAEQSQLFPYQFVYKNVLAGPVNDRWETDMHFVTAREGLTRVPADVLARCYTQSVRLLSGRMRRPDLLRCEAHNRTSPFAAEQGTNSVPSDDGDSLWVLGRKYRGSPPPALCYEVANVTRRLRTEVVVLSYVLRCDPAAFK